MIVGISRLLLLVDREFRVGVSLGPSEAGRSPVETVKTASFEYLIDLAEKKPDGGYRFVLDGEEYHLNDVLEISAIASRHGYIVIY